MNHNETYIDSTNPGYFGISFPDVSPSGAFPMMKMARNSLGLEDVATTYQFDTRSVSVEGIASDSNLAVSALILRAKTARKIDEFSSVI